MSAQPRTFATAALALFCAAVGCGGSGPPAGDDIIKSNQPRLDGTTVPAADVAQQAADNEAFSFNLYAQLKGTTTGNLFFSPYSVSSALAMTWAGAANDTATAISTALDFSLPQARAHAAFDAIDQELASRAKMGTSANGQAPFALNVANALWAQKGLTLETPFLNTLAIDYGAGVHIEDFAGAPDPARAAINAAVSSATDGKIPMLLGPGTITTDTRFVITNAVYFSGSWATHFDATLTKSATFNEGDGSSASVPFMNGTFLTTYGSGTGWQSVELPYSNPDLTLTIVVPDAGQLAAVEAQLSASFFDGLVAAEQVADVTLSLPKFSATTQASLKTPLSTLGMTAAFEPTADFSGIDGAHDLLIGDVIHQATVTVDENGTEAAAATAVIGVGSVVLKSETVTVDRPFFIVLRDVPTHSILFVGRISHI